MVELVFKGRTDDGSYSVILFRLEMFFETIMRFKVDREAYYRCRGEMEPQGMVHFEKKTDSTSRRYDLISDVLCSTKMIVR